MDMERRSHIYTEWVNDDWSHEYNNRLAVKYDGFKYCIHADTISGVFPFDVCYGCPHRTYVGESATEDYCKMILKRWRELTDEAHEETERKLWEKD